jgi:hypothetical protein
MNATTNRVKNSATMAMVKLQRICANTIVIKEMCQK